MQPVPPKISEIVKRLMIAAASDEQRKHYICAADQVAVATSYAEVGPGITDEIWQRRNAAYIGTLQEIVAVGTESPRLKKSEKEAFKVVRDLNYIDSATLAVQNGSTLAPFMQILQAGAQTILKHLAATPAYREMAKMPKPEPQAKAA